MSKLIILAALFGAAGCGETIPNSCEVSCTADSDCPSGQTCGEVGMCTSGTACSCTPGEFFGCTDQGASHCASNGQSVEVTQCGTAGCNADLKACNACASGDTVCSSDGKSIETCGTDGKFAPSLSCAAGCISASGAAPRCGNIEPAWLPTVCDMPATADTATFTATLDVQNDASCTGGVVVANGTTFCIVRAKTITIPDLKVTGSRAVAFVADDALTVTGVLDISADGSTSGPGAGSLGVGGTSISASYKGGGGAGFATAGGTGGGNDAGTDTGAPGGSATQRMPAAQFQGGAPGGASLCGNGVNSLCLGAIDFPGGGGGGGAMLIACRGNVVVGGTIDANGGGGPGGGDHYTAANSIGQGGGPGGGSGGFVAIQGVQVSVTGRVYANGGGGGGACGTDNCRGPAGQDGGRTLTGALGGDPAGNTGGGGIGGSVSSTPGVGERTFAVGAAGSGGGGGAMGAFQVFTPMGNTPTLTPAQASPAPVAAATSLLVK